MSEAKPKVAFIGTGGTISSLGAGPLDILDYGATGNRMQADAIAALFHRCVPAESLCFSAGCCPVAQRSRYHPV